MDIVLGVSMTPSAVRMVLVEGENADGASLDHNAFDVAGAGAPAMSGAPQQVLDAILGTRESAAEGGHRLTSVGVAWTDHAAAARLRQALRQHRLEDVVLVSELHAASALAQAIGETAGYARTALLFIEADTATLAVVQTSDGAVVRVMSRGLLAVDAVPDLQSMVAVLDTGDEPPQAVFMVGSGVDIAALKPQIEAATTLPVHAPGDGDLALARGAALAAADTPRYEASTVGLGLIDDTAAGPTQMAAAGYMAPLGYSAVPDDDEADLFAYNGPAIEADVVDVADEEPGRRPFLLVGSALSTVFVVGIAALAISLAVVIRPTADHRPDPGGSPVVSSIPAPVPAQAKDIAPPAAPETIQAPIPVVQEAPRTVFVAPQALPPAPDAAPAPAAPPPALAPAPEVAPAPEAAPPPPPPAAPAPAPAAPPPAPVVPAPAPAAAPVFVPVPILLPPIFQAPARTAPAPRTPSSSTATNPTYPSTPTYATVPSRPSYPTSTPPVTTYPTYPSNSYPTASSAAPSSPAPSYQAPSSPAPGTGSRSSGSESGSAGSSDSGASSPSRGPLWPLWPFGG